MGVRTLTFQLFVVVKLCWGEHRAEGKLCRGVSHNADLKVIFCCLGESTKQRVSFAGVWVMTLTFRFCCCLGESTKQRVSFAGAEVRTLTFPILQYCLWEYEVQG